MNYILVENGQIVGSPRPLPVSWKNVSNFHVLDNETLKTYGWYPYNFVEAEVGYNQVYDVSNIVIGENDVTEYQQVRNKTEQEIENEKQSLWQSIRYQRNELLKECDWTQLKDSPLSEQKREEWQTYRQTLRDITLQNDPYNINWPPIPV